MPSTAGRLQVPKLDAKELHREPPDTEAALRRR